ncbi:MAG: AIPR family protein, partial [Candidatus Desantisbacteria bacterium]
MSIIQSVIQANLDNLKPYLPESKKESDSFAFLIFAITSTLDITINEAILCSTEGKGDGGIDAIYIDETEDNIIIHIFQTKYRTNLDKGIGKNEIDLTIAKVEEIFQGNIVENQSPIIGSRIEEIRDIIQEKAALKMPEVHIHFAVNTFTPNETDKERAKQLEEKGNYFVFFYDGNDLLQVINRSKLKDCKINVTTYKDILCFADRRLGDVRGIVANISAQELINIYEAAGRDKALSRNIRYFLGNNKINKKIRQTASSINEAKYFWFSNNGVTIVCDKFSFTDDARGNKIISVSNPKIINGGQTTKSLHHLILDKSLNEVYLLLRLYETDNEELIDKITENTNSQNPIFERDLKANHEVQLMVKKYFYEKGYFYETHRNEYVDKKIDKNKIASNERVFQAYISLFKEMPHEAKSSKSKIFERYFDDVFLSNDDNLPQKLLTSHELLLFIENQSKHHYSDWKNGDVFLYHSELALVYFMGKIYPYLKENDAILQDSGQMKNIYKLSVVILRYIIVCERLKDMDYSHNKFFKSREMVTRISRLITNDFLTVVNQIFSAKQRDIMADTSEFEKQISQ